MSLVAMIRGILAVLAAVIILGTVGFAVQVGYASYATADPADVGPTSADGSSAGGEQLGPAGSHYAFLAPASADDAPVAAAHWCAAQTIGYRIDMAGARAAGLDPEVEKRRWRQTFDAWARASGGAYRFEFRGEGWFPLKSFNGISFELNERFIEDGEIAITYGRDSFVGKPWLGYQDPRLEDMLAIGGIAKADWGGRDAGQIRKSAIVVDALDIASGAADPMVVYRHEAGHALGLAHVDDPAQIMFERADEDSTMGPGDRLGLRVLAGLPC